MSLEHTNIYSVAARVQPVGKREEENEKKVVMYRLFVTGSKGLENYEHTIHTSKYTQVWHKNRAAIDGDYYGEDADVDHCALCACEKSLCLEQDTHFGERDESPPDNVCELCGYGFGNDYSSTNRLTLHRLSGEGCHKEIFEVNR